MIDSTNLQPDNPVNHVNPELPSVNNPPPSREGRLSAYLLALDSNPKPASNKNNSIIIAENLDNNAINLYRNKNQVSVPVIDNTNNTAHEDPAEAINTWVEDIAKAINEGTGGAIIVQQVFEQEGQLYIVDNNGAVYHINNGVS